MPKSAENRIGERRRPKVSLSPEKKKNDDDDDDEWPLSDNPDDCCAPPRFFHAKKYTKMKTKKKHTDPPLWTRARK